jgi:hypothetical protein
VYFQKHNYAADCRQHDGSPEKMLLTLEVTW